MNPELTWGLAGNQLLHISDVPNGLACGCACPECHQPLVAKQGTGLRRPHFAHHAENVPTCATAQETALHRLAKEILLQNQKINLPESRHAESGEIIDPPQYRSYSNPREEVRQGALRPDVIVEVEWGALWLEIFVSHRVGNRRLRKIQDANRPTVEIRLDAEALLSRVGVEQAVVHDIENKRWIHPRDYKPRRKKRPLPPLQPEPPAKMLAEFAVCRWCGEMKRWAILTPSTGEGVCMECLPVHNAAIQTL